MEENKDKIREEIKEIKEQDYMMEMLRLQKVKEEEENELKRKILENEKKKVIID